ncbi:family 16 glycosylhydrolase [Wenxinia marina]|uniref:Beta-glucanase/Beta-glucan synthetase n=1 Tax=Wenxinia marina DSM 24838 TaxID=1123501 RepID=A0A0D0NLY6_9RHOB|nr:family 16 glycosylhydrolase [Wenxinia marina]KIQ69295.1 Beta-glucanase/Beta-glucan synthetase [Wenxinia marina DSM 24838]
MSRTARCIALVLALAGSCPASAAEGEFLDNFDRLDAGRWFVSDGWSNGSHQNCLWSRRNVAVTDGQLVLSITDADVQDADVSLACAEIQSEGRYGYGTFEMRAQIPFATGLNANFFTFVGAPQNQVHNEIDFEFIAPRSPVLQTNFHRGDEHDHEELVDMPADDSFRTYSMTWRSDSIQWYIDGDLVREVEGDNIPNLVQKIYLSIWSTDQLVEWMGSFDPASAPQQMRVDWVAYTPLGHDCHFEGSVLCEAEVATTSSIESE